jgi:hypothetical protein
MKLKLNLIYIVTFTLVRNLLSFHLPHYSNKIFTLKLQLNLNAVSTTSLVRRGKKKEVDILRQEIEQAKDKHYISQFLNGKNYQVGIGPAPIKFYDFTFSKKGTLKLFVEYNQKAKVGFIMGIPPPEVMGSVFRETSHAVLVSMDKRNGGNTPSDFYRFTKEQYRARKSSPGAVPIVWNDFIVDELQIVQAAALGGAGVVLTPEMTDDLSGLIACTHKYDMGAVVLIKNLIEYEAAIAAGARSICIYGLDEEKLIDLRNKIPDQEGIQIGARLRPIGDFSTFAEVDTAWALRDHGFNFLWPSTEAVFGNGINDVYTCLFAMRAKASRAFYSPRQYFMERNKEGAQEYLGDILY